MTKLLEWLTGGIAFTSIWLALVLDQIIVVPQLLRIHVLLLPIYAISFFGLVSVAIIVYRTATFNDCTDAANELRRQIKEAHEDLSVRGFKAKATEKK